MFLPDQIGLAIRPSTIEAEPGPPLRSYGQHGALRLPIVPHDPHRPPAPEVPLEVEPREVICEVVGEPEPQLARPDQGDLAGADPPRRGPRLDRGEVGLAVRPGQPEGR